MSNPTVSGIEPEQRQLNGPQTTGREYRNLSEPTYTMAEQFDVSVPMRDGINLLADIYYPAEPGTYPVLVAASPYPRQIQNSGAPLGFIEAGASDFFVPRGYVHVIVNLRGTGGSGGTFTFADHQEREDMYDLVEWAGVQSWSNGNVGMIGISYFAVTQMQAAVMRPPHLKAIMPLAATFDFYSSSSHHGLVSTSFMTSFLYMIGMTSSKTNKLWRSKLIEGVSKLLRTPTIHKKFEHANGEAVMAGLQLLLKLKHNSHPWDDLWRSVTVEHPFKDEWWDDRDMTPLINQVEVPVYLGCDWENIAMHLPETFPVWDILKNRKTTRVAMMGEHGLAWPWESMHIEALAWYDHWLKGRDTGIMDGPKFRYVLTGENQWLATDEWPLPDVKYQAMSLRVDGGLNANEGKPGSRNYMVLSTGLHRPGPVETDPASYLVWESDILKEDMRVAGPIELQLDATITAPDTAWIVILQDIDEAGNTFNVTSGYLRAGLREIDEKASSLGNPVLPCRNFQAVPVGEKITYRIPLVANARRFKTGHKLRFTLTSDDQPKEIPSSLGYRHANIGLCSLNTIYSSSKLLLPVLPA